MKRVTTIFTIIFAFTLTLTAQSEFDQPSAQEVTFLKRDNIKKPSLEIGVHTGHLFTSGNIDFTPGFATGVHVRHSLDYMFSWRLDLMYGKANGEDPQATRSFTNKWRSASLQAIANLNNLKFGMENRKTNLYAFVGAGLNSFSIDLNIGSDQYAVPNDMAFHSEFGLGLAWRINPQMNLGFEHKMTRAFGERSDWLDGIQTIDINSEARGSLRDVMHYTGVRLNFNIGTKKGKTEPLYWINPLDVLARDINNLKVTRVTLNDADEDGVVDKLDKEKNTPEGAKVDTKGRVLDSDNDGIVDHLDKEPYSPKAFEVNEFGVAQMPDIEAMVNKMVEEKLKDFEPIIQETSSINTENLYLPGISFSSGGYGLQTADYITLKRVAQIINDNPSLQFTITGFTDETGKAEANLILSYKRSKTVVDYLIEQEQVNEEQLILQWKGEEEMLLDGAHIANRRVEIKVAPKGLVTSDFPENWKVQKVSSNNE